MNHEPSPEIRQLIENSSWTGIIKKLQELVESDDKESVSTLKEFLLEKVGHLYMKHDVPRLASLALLRKGPEGVRTLGEVIHHAPGSIYPAAIFETLWHASRGRTTTAMVWDMEPPASFGEPLPPETVNAAQETLGELILESTVNEDIFAPLMEFLHLSWVSYRLMRKADEKGRFPGEIFEVLTEGRIKISKRLLSEFESMMNECNPEESYQLFLKANPVFLDPLASIVISKQRLGIECVTDFVIRRLDSRYVLVEIEKPHDKIFTTANDFTAPFSHAFGQVLDFQQWVEAHAEYARNLMPGISSPRGLLIIGRSSDLTEDQKQKLERFNANSMRVDVRTFDQVAFEARRLYENIHHRNE